MNSPHPRRGDGDVAAAAGHAPVPGSLSAGGPGTISQAMPPRQPGTPSGGRVALIPLSATRPIPYGAQQ